MAYTPTNVFAAGTPMVAADIQENIEDIQEYVNGLNVSGDFATDNWAVSDFFVQGKYYTFGNYQELMTGVCKGGYPFYKYNPGLTMEAHGDAETNRGSVNSVSPKSSVAGITFYMEEPGDVLLHLQIYSRVPTDSVKITLADIADERDRTMIGVRFDGQGIGRRAFIPEQAQMGVDAINAIPSWEASVPYQMHVMQKNVSAGEHTFEVFLGTNCRGTYNKLFNYSLTAFYT